MTNNSTKILLLATLMSGMLISISSNSWLGAWIGLEINLLSFIPLMSTNKNVFTTEASMKYFIVQALASSTLLFLIISKSMIEELYTFSNNYLTSVIINTPLLLKSGAAPFHWWFPSIMEGLSWSNCFILMTIQKMAPLMLISYYMTMNTFMWIIILISIIIGSIGGLNQISIRKILTYSSINHMGWMLAAMNIGENMWIFYFLIYSMLTLTIITIVSSHQISFINQTFLMSNELSTMKFLMFTTLLSLGGLPPFLGFLPKWIIIQHMIINEMNFLISLMVIMSLMTLYYYLRICYASFMILYAEPKWNIQFYNNKILLTSSILSSISMLGLVLCTMAINIF
uniref:NADH-ubiquinone oxidoreductase chain 2 n=1 Tax=Shelfordella lateralis TaxID=36981 RepID=A0A143GVV4_SHELA|nr:NADH dehydrogenase subunit 2 [Periplaneta lateralis]AMW91066.1 NADH dehydrogenase subunit 2 [Periplaneta lateralis]UEV86523.1 NADH dehydrogenase subunit 2 [Periplaneta lateralis]